ncbi:vegetative cell wall protein gp1-like [Galendromus occidentalis]|uniref:Vegetative cell wall protein gp1-like n=1 Tax=Galendromus occidentalis TaxID=34638 RepID=A0AAJ7L2K6_9ACAR|nr:vegetative cell wall protein gp1-like [Galendromus occidentalis]
MAIGLTPPDIPLNMSRFCEVKWLEAPFICLTSEFVRAPLDQNSASNNIIQGGTPTSDPQAQEYYNDGEDAAVYNDPQLAEDNFLIVINPDTQEVSVADGGVTTTYVYPAEDAQNADQLDYNVFEEGYPPQATYPNLDPVTGVGNEGYDLVIQYQDGDPYVRNYPEAQADTAAGPTETPIENYRAPRAPPEAPIAPPPPAALPAPAPAPLPAPVPAPLPPPEPKQKTPLLPPAKPQVPPAASPPAQGTEPKAPPPVALAPPLAPEANRKVPAVPPAQAPGPTLEQGQKTPVPPTAAPPLALAAAKGSRPAAALTATAGTPGLGVLPTPTQLAPQAILPPAAKPMPSPAEKPTPSPAVKSSPAPAAGGPNMPRTPQIPAAYPAAVAQKGQNAPLQASTTAALGAQKAQLSGAQPGQKAPTTTLGLVAQRTQGAPQAPSTPTVAPHAAVGTRAQTLPAVPVAPKTPVAPLAQSNTLAPPQVPAPPKTPVAPQGPSAPATPAVQRIPMAPTAPGLPKMPGAPPCTVPAKVLPPALPAAAPRGAPSTAGVQVANGAVKAGQSIPQAKYPAAPPKSAPPFKGVTLSAPVIVKPHPIAAKELAGEAPKNSSRAPLPHGKGPDGSRQATP